MMAPRRYLYFLLFWASTLAGCRADAPRPGCSATRPSPPEPPRAQSVEVPATATAGAWNERTTPPVPQLTTTDPRPRLKVRWWMPRHEQLKKKVATMSAVEILFVGDSITEEWAESGEALWYKHFAHRALNLGVAGDRTQHILWRLQNSPFTCGKLRNAVVLAGTNNLGDQDSDADIFEGIAAIVYHLLDQCPAVHVIVMGILPREPSSLMGSIRRINELLAKLDNGSSIRFLDLSPKFLAPDGTIPRFLMPDGLHLSSRGYRLWAEALLPMLD